MGLVRCGGGVMACSCCIVILVVGTSYFDVCVRFSVFVFSCV
jgi:hypothetical protein